MRSSKPRFPSVGPGQTAGESAKHRREWRPIGPPSYSRLHFENVQAMTASHSVVTIKPMFRGIRPVRRALHGTILLGLPLVPLVCQFRDAVYIKRHKRDDHWLTTMLNRTRVLRKSCSSDMRSSQGGQTFFSSTLRNTANRCCCKCPTRTQVLTARTTAADTGQSDYSRFLSR